MGHIEKGAHIQRRSFFSAEKNRQKSPDDNRRRTRCGDISQSPTWIDDVFIKQHIKNMRLMFFGVREEWEKFQNLLDSDRPQSETAVPIRFRSKNDKLSKLDFHCQSVLCVDGERRARKARNCGWFNSLNRFSQLSTNWCSVLTWVAFTHREKSIHKCFT